MNAIRAADADDLAATMTALGEAARAAAAAVAAATAGAKETALRAAAAAVRARAAEILQANDADMATCRANGVSAALADRTRLDPARVEAIARGLDDVAALPDPVGAIDKEWTRPNGLTIRRVRVPIGVVAIIFEARPNVTADAGALCLKSGNVAILRGGSESFESSRVLVACLHDGLRAAGLPTAAIGLVPTRDREAVGHLLRMAGLVDVVVPRGGRSLIERVMREARVPVIAHLDGLCHTYVHRGADPDKARRIVVNAKMRRVSVCGATETLLVDREVALTHLPPILHDLFKARCEIRGDEVVQRLDPRVVAATEADWRTEYLDAVLAVRVVDGLDAAIAHVNGYGSHHTDAIVTEDEAAAAAFCARVDSAIVLHNASTQFADGGEFGFGAEIGISTGRLPPRGPVGAEQLTSYKYVVLGDGQIRP
ncbi:MAG: glutamate-5-semialdehyde dehydrogenase [Alphaproteobacteria bacterium]|nr:glutamate-5-semialdehyde dehydrogenase [Alphaproteobacteria bacterium]